MLQLILGGSGSGTTALLYQRIRTLAQAGKKSILLVPEQFTSSTEGRIYRERGDELSVMVDSFSFTSLAERISPLWWTVSRLPAWRNASSQPKAAQRCAP